MQKYRKHSVTLSGSYKVDPVCFVCLAQATLKSNCNLGSMMFILCTATFQLHLVILADALIQLTQDAVAQW